MDDPDEQRKAQGLGARARGCLIGILGCWALLGWLTSELGDGFDFGSFDGPFGAVLAILAIGGLPAGYLAYWIDTRKK